VPRTQGKNSTKNTKQYKKNTKQYKKYKTPKATPLQALRVSGG
jgi:hypothetical protein